jgi:hypothetical protein
MERKDGFSEKTTATGEPKNAREPGARTTFRVVYWGVVVCLLLLCLGIVRVGYNVKQNLASKADCGAYDDAMRAGNGIEAIELAKRIERRGSFGADRADYMLAQAYETAGDYDRAAERLTSCGGEYCDDWARLDYKRGRKREAFDAWIAAAERVISRPLCQEQVVREIWNETGAGTFVDAKDYVKTKLRAKFRGGATMEKSSYRKLAIFATYADFLACMEAEFAALSESEQAERAAAMDFIRSVATDPNVERDLYPLER